MHFQLNNHELSFPHPSLADEDGLLAIGGDLSVQRLLLAYSNGIFPWFNEGEPILWFAPPERCVIYPARIKISKSMQKVLDRNLFEVTVDTCFEQVIKACATIKRIDQDGTWITTDMQQAYLNLHQHGYAHSIEVWKAGELVGGLYGVLINRVFCGESMFSKVDNASKTALIYLSLQFELDLIDCQIPNDHLMRMGAEMITMDRYLTILQVK